MVCMGIGALPRKHIHTGHIAVVRLRSQRVQQLRCMKLRTHAPDVFRMVSRSHFQIVNRLIYRFQIATMVWRTF